ncbi:regulatory protein, luxR family [Chryseobacterium sp. YR221]|nr:regulatory protein, luxR family [Chryseobacterium sp. YR221]
MLKVGYKKQYQIFFLILLFLGGCNKKKDIAYLNEALDRSERLRLEGKKDEMVALNKKIISISKREGFEKEEALAYVNLSFIYRTVGNYKLCQYYLELAGKIAVHVKDNFLYTKLYHEYGEMNYAIGLTYRALDYNSKAIYYGKKLNQRGWLLGNIYEKRAEFILSKNSDSAFIYYHKGFDVDPSAFNSSLIGYYHLQQTKNLDSASFYINKAILLLKKKDYWTSKCGVVYSHYAQLLFEQKDYPKALQFYEKSLQILQRTKRINKLPDLYRQIALTYKKLNNTEKENEYLLKCMKLSNHLKQSGNDALDLSVSKTIEKKETSPEIIFFSISIGILFLLEGAHFLFFKYQTAGNIDITIPPNEAPDKKVVISNDHFSELYDLLKTNDVKFLNRFEEIHPAFFQKLLKINAQLTQSELSLCAMIWLGFSSKDIADLSFMQHRSVQTKKGRLRKKLNISSETDLYNFFKNL